MTAVIRFEHVSLRYGARTVVSDVSLAIEHEAVLSLVGRSGCGKSSLVRLALGLVAPTAGRIWLGQREASGAGRVIVPPEQRGLGVVFQDLGLWPHLSVEAHLSFVLSARRVPKRGRVERIGAMLTKVGLADRRRSYPGTLSGGEQQRLAIARALVVEPEVLLLDEPLANLDLMLKRELLAMFRDLFAEHRTTLVYVTHDVREAAFLDGQVTAMEGGKIIATGTLDALHASAHPLVRELTDSRLGARAQIDDEAG